MGLRWGLFFKIILVLLFVALLAHELCSGDKLRSALTAFRAHWEGANALWALAALLLLPLNWGAETRKWLLLLRVFSSDASWRLALRGVLAGVTLAVFTPNRLGEFGGRALVLPPELRWRAAAANVASTLSQTLVVLAAGGAGLWWFVREVLRPQPFYSTAVAVLTLLGVAALMVFYLQVGRVVRYFVSSQRSAANGQRPMVNGQRSMANGQRSPATSHRPPANGQPPTVNRQRSTVNRLAASPVARAAARCGGAGAFSAKNAVGGVGLGGVSVCGVHGAVFFSAPIFWREGWRLGRFSGHFHPFFVANGHPAAARDGAGGAGRAGGASVVAVWGQRTEQPVGYLCALDTKPDFARVGRYFFPPQRPYCYEQD